MLDDPVTCSIGISSDEDKGESKVVKRQGNETMPLVEQKLSFLK